MAKRKFIIPKDRKSHLNTVDEQLQLNIRKSIRRRLPQVRPHPPNDETIILVGGGPSLEMEFDTLLQLHWQGCKLVAMNGSYNYLISKNLRPSAMVLIDARPFNARFCDRPMPNCKYFLASQCDESIFNTCEGRECYIFHCVNNEDEAAILDEYYCENWIHIPGGSTVMLRSIMLFRTLGFQKMHVFGFDSCYLNERDHSYSQPENEEDRTKARVVTCMDREFLCAPWHVDQAYNFQDLIRNHGDKFKLSVHGDGLIAHMLRRGAEIEVKGDLGNGGHSLDGL